MRESRVRKERTGRLWLPCGEAERMEQDNKRTGRTQSREGGPEDERKQKQEIREEKF